MFDKVETYKIWAPDDALWTQWAKPVLFARVPAYEMIVNARIREIPLSWIAEKNYYSIIVVDLPGRLGVEEGLSLARLGFRPVPLYNGVNDPSNPPMVVDAMDIVTALFIGAEELRNLRIMPLARPAFLLDSKRMPDTMFKNQKIPGWYDNRWCVFPQDMPSAAFLWSRGIREVIVRSDKIRDDLAHVLLRYQDQGIGVFLCDGSDVKAVTVHKPSRFRSLFYRFKVIFGLTRNPAGGFGGRVPRESGGGG
jgi:hypothetical protein